MLDWIGKVGSAISKVIDVTDLARAILDQVVAFRRWLFVTDRGQKYDQAEKKIAESGGDTSALEDLFQDPSGD